MKYTKQIRQLLQQRGAGKWEKEFAENASKSRVSSLKRLTDSESQKLIAFLTESTAERFLKSIYRTAFDLKVISNQEANAANDLLIIEYCIMVFSINKSEFLLNKTVLNQLNYIQLYTLAADFGAIYLQYIATKN